MWAQVSQSGRVFCGLGYSPPVGDRQLRVRCVERWLKSLAKETIAADAYSYVFRGGHFNAKIGSLSSPALQHIQQPVSPDSTCGQHACSR